MSTCASERVSPSDVANSPALATPASPLAFAVLGGCIGDGIVAASDVIAISAMRALEVSGIKVPDDVAVIGYDDIPIAQHVAPSLTTVRQDLGRGARLLVEKLFNIMAGSDERSQFMPTELIIRQSG